MLIIELFYTAKLQYIYGRSVVLLYQPTFDEKTKSRLLEIFTHFNAFLYIEGLLKWTCFAAILLHSNSFFSARCNNCGQNVSPSGELSCKRFAVSSTDKFCLHSPGG